MPEEQEPRAEFAHSATPADRRAVVAAGSEATGVDSVLFRFEDVRGGAVAGVQLFLLSSPFSIGQSDERGSFRLFLTDPSAPLSFRAEHPDTFPLDVRLAPPFPPERSCVLQPRARIRGVIVDVLGNPVPTRPRVLAYPEDQPPSTREVFAASQGKPVSLFLSRANEKGEFTLTNLEPETSYELLVGGGGVANASPHRTVSDSDVVVRVSSVFGARVGIQAWSGSRTALWESPGPTWSWHREFVGASGFTAESLTAALLGLDPSETLRGPSNPMPMLFLAESSAGEVGPIHLRGTPAGYEALEVELFLPRFVDTIRDVWIETTPRAAGWGRLRIDRRMPDSFTAGVGRRFRVGEVQLVAPGAVFESAFLDWSSDPLDVGPVPYGTYSVALDMEVGYAHHPAHEARVEIGPGTDARVTIDLSASCEVGFGVWLRGSNEAMGECSIEVSHELGGQMVTSFADFSRPPYVVQGLVPGRYGFTIHRPFHDPAPLWLDLPLTDDAPQRIFVER